MSRKNSRFVVTFRIKIADKKLDWLAQISSRYDIGRYLPPSRAALNNYITVIVSFVGIFISRHTYLQLPNANVFDNNKTFLRTSTVQKILNRSKVFPLNVNENITIGFDEVLNQFTRENNIVAV